MLKFILCAYLLLSLILAQEIVEEDLKDHEPLARAVLYVTEKYISKRTNTVIIMQMCKHCTNVENSFQNRLLDYVLLHSNGLFSWLLFSDESHDQPWNFNIFITNSVEAFSIQINQIQLNLYEIEFYFLVVFTNTKDMSRKELHENLVEIAKQGLSLNVINVVIMVENRNGTVIFYRSHMHGRDCGRRIDIESFNHIYAGESKRQFLFPYRLRNFKNCTMRIAAYDVPPFLIFNGDKKNKSHLQDSSRLEGIDGLLLRILKETLNFHTEIIFPKEKGELFQNGSVTGCWAMLKNGTVDVIVSNFGLLDTHLIHFSPSVVYHQSATVAVVRSGIQYSPLKQLMCPFKAELWNLLIWLFSINLVLIGFLRKLANKNLFSFVIDPKAKRPTAFNLFVTLMGLPASCLPQRNFTRLLIFCWLFLTFVLRNIYQGKMFDSLRAARRMPLPRSLDGLILHQFHMISREYLDFYPHNLTWIVNEDYPTRFAMLENAESSMRIASYSLIDYLAHHNYIHWNTSQLTMINDPMKLFQLVMYFKKHSRFKYAFDMKLKQLLNAGIVSQITKTYLKRELRVSNEFNLEVPQINFGMLFGLYAIYAGLMSWAILIFTLEILSRKIRLLRWVFEKLQLFE